MTRSTASAHLPLLFLLLAASACSPAEDERPGEPFFDPFEASAFYPAELLLDVPALFDEDRDAAATPAAWRVPRTRFLGVAEGWGGPEEWGAWGLGLRTRVPFYLPSPGAYDVFVEGRAPPDPGGREQRVEVRLNGVAVGDFTADAVWQSFRLEVPEEALHAGENVLELVYAYHLDDELADDDRPLAFGFKRLGILSRGRDPSSLAAPGWRLFRDQELVVLEEAGTWVVPVAVPADARTLELELKTSLPLTGPAEASFAVRLVALDGGVTTLTPRLPAAEREMLSFDLAGHRGEDVVLVFDAHLQRGARFTVKEPRLVRGPAPPPAPPPEAAGRPPIVLIVLDAARADHFGLYGYDRDTTPHVDRLGAESLVFGDVVAECSYTLCSMPSLLTGLSFADHGMVTNDLALAGDVTTLAETLSEQGYLTLGYTGNPNNSRLTGTDQGFAELSEVWEVHPRHITERVLERLDRLAAADPERPFFLMIHWVPPHEPYAPDPAFDVFGDPAYDGPVTSDRELTQAIYDQKIELDDEDKAELVSLYDGNLKMVDAAVGEVLGALEAAGIYDRALVVLTSDHGEGFNEHGRVGHNTTVYEEMLHVPLVLKLPRSVPPPAEPFTDRLATLYDVVPTIHALLGLAPPPGSRGRDLLAPPPEERLLYLRSAHRTDPIFGVRTSRYKALVRKHGVFPELYDLRADPGERDNRVMERPLLHAGLALMLERTIAAPSPLRAGERQGELSSKDRDHLRALGYL